MPAASGPAAEFRILGIDHVVLRAPDRGALARFYVDVLGCSVAWDRPELGLVHLRAGRTLIDIVDSGRRSDLAPPDRRAPNVDHICLIVEPFDAEAVRRHLAAHGVEADPPVERFGAEGNGPSIYLADPLGNRIELKGPGQAR